MKKLLSVVMAALLILTTILPTVAFAAVDYSYIRVRLDSMKKPTSVTFKFNGAYRIAEAPSVDLYPKITYTLKTEGSGHKLTYKNGVSTVSVSLPSKVTFVQYSNGSGSNYFYLNNATSGWRNYAGNMTFRHIKTASSDYIEAVNTVFIETYLYGVIASEMGNDWPAEALKAQAVCARTYAMAYIKSRQAGSLYYDVVDTSSNQVYKGYPLTSSGAAQTNVINAVNATRGKALFIGSPSLGNFADGMYSASNGGQVRTLSMRYGSATNTYHVFKEDPYDLKNTASPKFVFLFPKSKASLTGLGTADLNKANAMIDLIKDKVVAALAQQGVTCSKSSITVNAVKSAAPVSLRTGMPEGSREFTEVAVTVNVTIAGVTMPAPVVAVTGNGAVIADGSTTPSAANDTDFGSASVAEATVVRTYTITNSGNAALTISGITVTGDNAADFTVGSVPSSIAAGASATFTVTFDPSASGDRATTVSITGNDAASPYQFRIKGTGLNDGMSITAFKFKDFDAYPGTITGTDIAVNLPAGTALTALVAVFTTDAGASVSIGSVAQTSGTTPNDFSAAKTYTVTAQDGSHHQDYTVTVTAGAALAAPDAAAPSAAPAETDAAAESGGGGMPAGTTMDLTVTLKYISKAADGVWDVLGELRTKFASYSTLLNSTNLWLLYASSDSKFFYVTARGYGHGVGLSQRGAQQMAKENKTWLNILDFYFNTGAGKSTLGAVSVTQRTLPQIPGKGKSASYYKVNASTLSMRAAASTKGTLIYSLKRGTIVEVLSTSRGWSRVLYGAKGLVGYVSAKYLKKTTQTPPPAATAAPTATPPATTSATASASASASPSPTASLLMGRVVVAALYIRKTPSSTGAILYDHLVKGDSVVILDRNAAANWYKVRYASYTGYAMCQSGGATYIEIVGTAPTATPTPSATAGSTELKPVTAKANVSDYLTIRASASTSASKVGQIPANATFTVLQVASTANWLKVKYSSTTGYVLAKYAIIGGSSAYRACTVTASTLNARSGAGTSYSVVGTLESGDTVVVTSTVSTSSGKWYKIKFGTYTAYIDSRYARINTTS